MSKTGPAHRLDQREQLFVFPACKRLARVLPASWASWTALPTCLGLGLGSRATTFSGEIDLLWELLEPTVLCFLGACCALTKPLILEELIKHTPFF